MLILSFMQWWYSRGWGNSIAKLYTKLKDTADFFSIGLLLRTIFTPFRQLDANATGANDSPLESLKAFGDRLLSRIIGAIVRIFVIIGGVITLFVQLILGVASAILWPLLPIAPIAGIVLTVIGVTI